MNRQAITKLAMPLVVAAGLGFAFMPAASGAFVLPLSPSLALANAANQCIDGVYSASGMGIGVKVPVTVTIEDGKIASVEIGANSETRGIGTKAIEQLPEEIVEANGVKGVDAVSGASVTSRAILTAVDDCLEQAGFTDESDVQEADEPEAEGTYYNNGEYFAEGKGIGGKVPVTVTIDGGVIVSVEVGDNSETQGIGSKAIEQLPDAIVEANGTDGVDAVSGASVTSKAIFTAVDDCLEQAGFIDKSDAQKSAGTSSKTKKASAASETRYNDGEYFAEGKGIGGKVPVTVTIDGGVIVSVEVGDNSETQGIGSKAIEQLPDAIVEANGTDGVDAVSGASVTSKAIFTAVDDCLEQAGFIDKSDAQKSAGTSSKTKKASTASETRYNDGEYFAEGKGIGGKVPVTVTIDGGVIVSVEVGDNSETQGIGSKAIEQLPDAIVEANGTDGVDAVSGASVTSKAIFTAVDDCLEQAGFIDKSDAQKSAGTSSKTKKASTASETRYNDGEYFAEGKGIGGKVPVTVTIDGGVIVSVEVGDNSETQGIGSKAIEQLPDAIVEANGTDGVDAVSGASVTSKAIFTAVDDCLEQAGFIDKSDAQKSAGTSSKTKKASTASETRYNDGEYFAEGKGIGGKVPVTVTIDGGVIVSVEVGDNSETQGIGSKAIEQLPDAIVEANGTDGVDAVSGASVTSKAIFTAVDDCLEQAGFIDKSDAQKSAGTSSKTKKASTASETRYNDGEYFAEGKGIGGKVPVTVTIDGGVIVSVEVGDNSETQGIGSKAIEQLPDAIVEANGTDGVDAVSGASVTSKAIFTAVDDCLEQAGTTNAKPETTKTSTQSGGASSISSSDSSNSTIATTSDHLGTTRFGKMSVIVPDTYTCEKFDQSTMSDGTQSVEAIYTRKCSTKGTILIKEGFYEGAATPFLSNPGSLFEALAVVALQKVSDDGTCETISSAEELSNNSYFGFYTISFKGVDLFVIGGGAVDEDGNLLLVMTFIQGNVDSEDAFEVIRTIDGAYSPDGSSA